MDAETLRTIVLLAGATLILFWEWRDPTAQANRQYFLMICVGYVMTICGWVGIKWLSPPLSDIALVLGISGFAVMIGYILKIRKSKPDEETEADSDLEE